tara:strand:+ start:519 stop:2375 length:1857 start_codon:yes stop_codon:yes gene_type:complete
VPDTNCSSPDGMPSICPNELDDATAGEYYSAIATFYMPSNVEVDGIEASLISVSLASMTGVPFGLEIVPNNPTGVYYPSSGENHGCVTICGTPLIAGEYAVELTVDVVASAFGFEVPVTESFSLPFTVLEGETSNASFSASTFSGCSTLEVELINTINGPGTTYLWDLGGYGLGTDLTMNLTTDNYGAETTWNIIDENGTLVSEGGPFSDGQNNYIQNICVGNGCYTLNVYDSYGDGMQFGGVEGYYILTDAEGNELAEITSGGNFGAHAEHTFCIYTETPSGCTPTSSNPSVLFSEPGEYDISLVTTVTELVMTQLEIVSLSGGWSGDPEELFWGSPDPFFNINGDGIDFTSAAIDENETPTFSGLNIPLAYGSEYSISFYDEDLVSANDYLGNAIFLASAPGEYMINGGGNTAIITIVESISAQFEDSETIVVYDYIDAYLDVDEDGYGNSEFPVNGCDPELEYSVAFNGQDCNDGDATMYPGAVGTFSGIDNDCNTIIELDEEIPIYGCTEEGACNYDIEANSDDGSCEYESCAGCTDPLAINYNPEALIPDNSCEYIDCFGDFNNDGSITVSDLLILLAEFGCENNCEADLSGDGIVSVADLLEILAVYGTLCE